MEAYLSDAILGQLSPALTRDLTRKLGAKLSPDDLREVISEFKGTVKSHAKRNMKLIGSWLFEPKEEGREGDLGNLELTFEENTGEFRGKLAFDRTMANENYSQVYTVEGFSSSSCRLAKMPLVLDLSCDGPPAALELSHDNDKTITGRLFNPKNTSLKDISFNGRSHTLSGEAPSISKQESSKIPKDNTGSKETDEVVSANRGRKRMHRRHRVSNASLKRSCSIEVSKENSEQIIVNSGDEDRKRTEKRHRSSSGSSKRSRYSTGPVVVAAVRSKTPIDDILAEADITVHPRAKHHRAFGYYKVKGSGCQARDADGNTFESKEEVALYILDSFGDSWRNSVRLLSN